MVLFVSDMHFGRGPAHREREKERELIDCLEAHASELDHLYLLGDVFDGYIEFEHLVPKGFARFQGLLARWTDLGLPITYLLGNHDCWHDNYFAEELGVQLVSESVQVHHLGHVFHLSHGDAFASSHSTFSVLRPLLRQPAPLWLYRTLLPANVGLGFAKWVSRKLENMDPDPEVVKELRSHAAALLENNELDAVILGHSHVPDFHTADTGTYVNTGNWYEARSFVRLDTEGLHLQEWNGASAQGIESVPL